MGSNKIEFSWFTVLDLLIAGKDEEAHDYYNATTGELTISLWFSLHNRAEDWVTCACGELCSKLPKGMYGAPEDDYLKKRGREFCEFVFNYEWVKAKECLEKIEDRTAELLYKLETEKER